MHVRHSLSRQLNACVLAAALALSSCGVKQRPPLQAGETAFPEAKGFNVFSMEQEVQIGQQVAAQADTQLPLVPARDPVSDYVSTLGTRLARNLPENPYQFSFKVVNQKEINAFALPGGPIRLNLGIIREADNDAEVAGVLAHEIAHVYMRHATKNASKQQIAQVPAAILGGLLGGGTGGQLARLGLEFGLGSVFLKYSRDAESEADYVGAKLMYETGYDPRGMVSFFEKLAAESGSRGSEFFASHPNPGNRATSVSQAISQLPPKRFVTRSNEFAEVKRAALNMKTHSAQEIAQMQAQRQGNIEQVSRDSIVPSGQFRQLRHSMFQIAYPENWEAFGNSNSPVTIAPRAGVNQSAIAYGVIISGYQPQARQSLSQSAEQIFQSLQQSNPQMRAAGQLQPLSVQGLDAVAINLVSPSPLSDGSGRAVTERDMLVAIQRPDGIVIWMLFVAPERDFQALSPTFEQMLRSLRLG
jgi:beta-barrel assembly-enhancing protease